MIRALLHLHVASKNAARGRQDASQLESAATSEKSLMVITFYQAQVYLDIVLCYRRVFHGSYALAQLR